MGEINVFLAQLVRKNSSFPWGFRIEGGYDTGVPLRISMVSPGSPSASIGLLPGDQITKIFNRQTKFLSHKQAVDIISSVTTNELMLTIERSSEDLTNPYFEPQPQFENPEVFPPYQNQPISPTTFKETANISFHMNTPNYKYLPPIKTHIYQNKPHPPSQPHPPTHPTFHSDEDEDQKSIPQSATFKRLQSFMEQNAHPGGDEALPPPRSAAREKIKAQPGRMKVIMPQQYNSPMGMYSKDNVMDAFSSQVGSMLSEE